MSYRDWGPAVTVVEPMAQLACIREFGGTVRNAVGSIVYSEVNFKECKHNFTVVHLAECRCWITGQLKLAKASLSAESRLPAFNEACR